MSTTSLEVSYLGAFLLYDLILSCLVYGKCMYIHYLDMFIITIYYCMCVNHRMSLFYIELPSRLM